MNEQNKNLKKQIINQKRLEEEPKKAVEIRYELEKIPTWYIQGSFVLDKIFNKNFARDIDIFVPEGEEPPEIQDERPIHKIELRRDCYFPPLLGCYNTDRYLLTEQGIIRPTGFPEKPESLEFLGKQILTVIDVIRGIKISLRYGLAVSDTVKEAWQKVLEREFDPEWMKTMLFESEQEFIDYIIYNLKEETSEEERELVANELSKLAGKKLM
jgi:hypothetical protein